MAGIENLEKRILIEKYGKLIWFLRRQPWHAAHYLTGIALPPHERFWLGVYFGDTKENNVLASRGTSKSYTHASLAAPLKAVLYKDIAILTLSASGFRGGKELFKDAERMFLGQLKSQELPGDYLRASIARQRIIEKDPSIWTIALKSHSRYSTAPTNNPDQLRGLRANEVQLDERAFIDGMIPHKIIRPMLMVGMDFRRAAQGGDRNKMYQISTIDFTIRDWWNELQVAARDQKDEYNAWKARKEGDWQEYDRLHEENEGRLKTLSFSYTRIDYTDLLIPEFIVDDDQDMRYRVEYPREKNIEREDILRYDELDKVAYWYTYPVDKKGLEEPLRSGTVDPEIWKAEQRNIPISGSGNVFDHELIQKISERPISTGKKKRKEENEETDDEFYAPVMYSCGDPCVLGVDVARESDETTFVVIRLGEMAEGEFNPFIEKLDSKGRPMLGNTEWNHICWAESHRQMESTDAANKMRDIYERYNIVFTIPTAITLGIGGIAMDQKGGGSAIRDELGNPKPPLVNGAAKDGWVWDDVLKMYDPSDTKGFGHYSALNKPDKYWGGLRLINAQNADNMEWTFGARALMQVKKLYIAFWMPPSRWAWEKGLLNGAGEPDRVSPEFQKWVVGYEGIRRLKMQLLRLQTKVTESGAMKFVAPGDRTKEEGKKDLWAAMIYAVSLARMHLNEKTKESNIAPMVAPLILYTGSDGGMADVFEQESDDYTSW
jgi:hypothetical protein